MADQWYYTSGGQQAGPVSDVELRRLAAAGRLHTGDLVWRDGMPQWTPASAVPGLLPEAPSPRTPLETPKSKRPEYLDQPDFDRQEYNDRSGSRYDRDRDDDFRRRPRRREQRRGMSGGAKLAIGLGIGGGVLLLLVVVVIIIMLNAGGGDGPNQRTFNLQPNDTKSFNVHLKAGVRTQIDVYSDNDTDVDLYVYGPNNNVPLAFDAAPDQDCHVSFVPPVTGMYRFEVRNLDPFMGNRCRMRWSP